MGKSQKTLSIEKLESMPVEELRDMIVAIAHGALDYTLPPANELVDLLDFDNPVASSYWIASIDPDDLVIEDVCDSLRDHVSEERLREIENGEALDDDERNFISKKQTKSDRWEGGTTTEYFEIIDRDGRKAYFSEENSDDVGICGPSGGWSGPTAELPSSRDYEEQDEEGNISVFCVYRSSSPG